jgi:hypothetical protein
MAGRLIARERVGKHVSVETNSWKPAPRCVISRRFLGYRYAIPEEKRIEFRSVESRRRQIRMEAVVIQIRISKDQQDCLRQSL